MKGRDRDEKPPAVPAPAAPPPLAAMVSRTAQLTADRAILFSAWQAALAANEGNVTRAAASLDPPITRDRGNRITRRFRLLDYAASLRAATGNARGRPRKK